MSITKITIERVNKVEPHPDADRLDLVQVLGFQVISQRGNFEVGDAAVYFPPDILLPEEVAVRLGVAQYLKHAIFPGNDNKTSCRVGACRLRGLPSHGFLVPATDFQVEAAKVSADSDRKFYGFDLTDAYGAHKYVPPLRTGAGDGVREATKFHRYTSIENIQRYAGRIEDGMEVIITEKIHGTNARLGRIEGEYVAGSHNVQRLELNNDGSRTMYWQPMDQVQPLIDAIEGDVIVFGEIYGQGVQDMDYGANIRKFRVFDISVNGKYMDWYSVSALCDSHKVDRVPVLYIGPYSKEVVEEHTYGRTTLSDPTDIRCKFKGREGCVVRTVKEELTHRGNRRVLKSVSVDYRNRKGATDLE